MLSTRFSEETTTPVLAGISTRAALLVAGSSLTVAPASELPLWAKRHGAKVAIVNGGPTPMDDEAAAKWYRQAADRRYAPAQIALARLSKESGAEAPANISRSEMARRAERRKAWSNPPPLHQNTGWSGYHTGPTRNAIHALGEPGAGFLVSERVTAWAGNGWQVVTGSNRYKCAGVVQW